MEELQNLKPHSLLIENRSRVSVTGVTDVGCFDEDSIVLQTEHGALSLRGRELRIERIDLESGDVVAAGTVETVDYAAPPRKSRRARLKGL